METKTENLHPLRDGCFFVDNSMIELITTCPWLSWASIVERLRPAEDSAALRFGGFGHQGLAFRNMCLATQGEFRIEVDEPAQINLLSRLFTENPFEGEGWRNFDSAVKLFRAYNAAYPKEPFSIATNPMTGKPWIEQPFACDTHKIIRGWRIIYTGRIDVKIVMPDGSRFIMDHKTSSVLGDATWADWAVSEQFKGYVWADRECTGEEATGYYVDALGCRESIANAVFNDVTGTVVPIGKSKAVPVEFQRQPFFTAVPKGQIDEWFENMLMQVDEFLFNVERNTWPRHHKQCVGKYGKCQFYNVCSLPSESREAALHSAAYKENEWSPLYL